MKKSIFKQITIVTLAIITSLTMMAPSITVRAEGYDTTAPVMTSLTLSATEINAGDALTFTANITEEETGIVSARMYIHRPDGSYFAVEFPVYGGSSLTGTYTTSYTFDEYAEEGEYQIERIELKDSNNNVTDQYYEAINYANSRFFTVLNNGNVSDNVAPTLASINVEEATIEADGTNYAVVECHDADLMYINIWYRATDYPMNVITGRYVTVPVEVTSNGLYRVALPTSTYYGNWQITSVTLTDTFGNQGYTEVINNYGTTSFTVSEPEEPVAIDITAPTVDSITGTTTDIIIPGVASLVVSGIEEESATVTVSIGVTYNGRLQYYRELAEVVNGRYTANFTLEFDSTMPAGTYRVWTISVVDANNNSYNQDGTFFTYNLVNQYNDVTLNTTLSNPNLVNLVSDADEGSRFVINADDTTVSEELFTAIAGTDKTLVFDMDGIQWAFNGKDINANNIKDIDITTSVAESDITNYGYAEGTSGVIFNFAANGMLPGTATVKIKSDYITNKFDLSDNLFLACIRDSVEDANELSYNNNDNVIAMADVDAETLQKINTINSTSNELVQIENAGITIDEDGYVTIKMNHNSSYILTDKLPKNFETVATTSIAVASTPVTTSTTVEATTNTTSVATSAASTVASVVTTTTTNAEAVSAIVASTNLTKINHILDMTTIFKSTVTSKKASITTVLSNIIKMIKAKNIIRLNAYSNIHPVAFIK